MDTQNVSAQLYFKQLPVDPNATSVQSDAEIENAFQKQLNLASYYKTPGVFKAIQNDYINKTIGYLQVPDTDTPVVPVAQSIPATPWTSKSSFGSLSTGQILGISIGSFYVLIFILFIIALAYAHFKK